MKEVQHRKWWIIIMTIWMSGNLVLGHSLPVDNSPKFTITKKLLTTEYGLASHEVYCSLQDESGFMWFGTRNGLNRYDGKTMIHFTSQRDNLQGNKIVQLARDNAGHIFIEYGSPGFQLNTNGKVDVMNTTTMEVQTLNETFPDLPFREQDVYWISNKGSGEIYFLTAVPFRLWKYSSKNKFSLEYEMKDWDQADAFPFPGYHHTGRKSIFTKNNSLLKIFKLSTQYLISQDRIVSFKHQNVQSALPLGFTNNNNLLFAYTTKPQPKSFQAGMVTSQGEIDISDLSSEWNTKNIAGHNWNQIICATDGKSSMLYNDSGAIYLWVITPRNSMTQ